MADFKQPPQTKISYSTKSNRAAKMNDEKLKQLFNKLDTDNDGRIQMAELREYLADPDATEIGHTNINNLLSNVDADHSGTIEMQEFALMMTDPRVEKQLYRRLLYNIATSWQPKDQRQQAVQYWHVDNVGCYQVPPVFIGLVSLAQVICFCVNAALSSDNWLVDCANCYQTPANASNATVELHALVFVSSRVQYVYPLLTYALMQQGLRDLLFSLFIQLLLGIPIEMVHGVHRVAGLYLAAVVMGALLQCLVHPGQILVGSSAGVYALITLALAKTFVNWKSMPEPWLRLIIILGLTALDFVNVAAINALVGQQCSALSYTAHAGGVLAGLSLSLAIIDQQRLFVSWQRWARWLSLLTFGLLFTGLLLAVVAVVTAADTTTVAISRFAECLR